MYASLGPPTTTIPLNLVYTEMSVCISATTRIHLLQTVDAYNTQIRCFAPMTFTNSALHPSGVGK